MQKRCAFALIALIAGCGDRVVMNQGSTERRLPDGSSEPVGKPAVVGNSASAANACLDQDGEAVTHRYKAVGTEPFWAAEVEGRCVTYKTPENQQGTRIWTRADTGPDGPAWNGALHGREFQLYLKPSTGCSDGMSDRTYPLEAVLRVDGETRKGCASRD